MLLHDPASKTNTNWLELILHPFGVGTSPERPWTHLTHHGPDSEEATTFPHIVLSALLRGSDELSSILMRIREAHDSPARF